MMMMMMGVRLLLVLVLVVIAVAAAVVAGDGGSEGLCLSYLKSFSYNNALLEFDCSTFDTKLASDPLRADIRIGDADGLTVNVECEVGYLLVPASASQLICDNETGWIIPECKGF